MDSRVRRLARNEALFREVNERIATTTRGFVAGHADAVQDFLCECHDVECAQRIGLTLAEYEEVRSHPRRFVVAVGHESPAIEAEIVRRDGYSVVEKLGEAGEVAEDAA